MEPLHDTDNAIAIIGFSLRFPQEADSPDGFWKMLVEGRRAMTEVPADRFNVNGYYSPEGSRLDTIPCRGGHFLRENVALFDAPFFSMSAAEADCMDPEIRGLLETSYRAFENAGIPISEARGSNTSVYMGHITGEYEKLFGMDEEIQTKYRAIGNSTAMMSNRLSWFYDLKGPCMTIETACSSSLVALHLACNSLRRGESSMSIVGGSGLYLDPMASVIPLSNFNFLSPDSRCHSFDARANGYAKGEGFGVLVLKRVADALRDGDTIRAVVRGTSTNHDGQTASITKPSSEAQAQLIRDAYAANALGFAPTRYFEAHGTGTKAGDAIEARGILEAFGTARNAADPIYIGATKANIGHLEAAAGVAGVIKAILVLEEGIIPPIAGLENVSPDVADGAGTLAFPQKAIPWPQAGLRRASVGGYGYGGTNAHVVLDDALHYLQERQLVGRHHTKEIHPEPKLNGIVLPATGLSNDKQLLLPYLMLWSASDEKGLQRQADIFTQHSTTSIAAAAPTYLRDLAYTLGAKRNRLPWKSFALISSLDEMQNGLTGRLSKPVRSSSVAPSVHFVFTGQGAQWPTMGLDLLAFPLFKASVEDADRHFQSLGAPWSLIEEIKKDKLTTNIDDPFMAQPICTALQIALVDLLASWQIMPESVVGHSSGEIAAAYCAGGISKESAWSVAYFRGFVTSNLISSKEDDLGGMVAVSLSPAELQPYFDNISELTGASEMSVGCENSPKSSTVTGSTPAIKALTAALDAKGLFTRKLRIPVAYHSHYMLRVAAEYRDCIAGITPPPRTDGALKPKMFSSVTGDLVEPGILASADYWVQNLVSKVAFSDAVHNLYAATSQSEAQLSSGRENFFIEVGPHITMERHVKDSLPVNASIQYGTSMRRFVDPISTIKTLAGEVLARGYPVDIASVNKGFDEEEPKMLVDLPEYPFNHSKSYWLESRLSKSRRFRSHDRHHLLGNPCPDWNPSEGRWRYTIRLSDHPWLKDHVVNESILYPAAGMLVMAIEAARFLSSDDAAIAGYQLRDVAIHNAITVPEDERGVETEITLRNLSQNGSGSHLQNSREFCIYSILHGEYRSVCSGTIITAMKTTDSDVLCNSSHGDKNFSQRCTEAAAAEQVYKTFSEMGIEFGPTFQTLHDMYFHGQSQQATATVLIDDWRSKVESRTERLNAVVHPTVLDSLFQLSIISLTAGGHRRLPTMVPTQVADLWISQSLLTMQEGQKLHLEGQALSQKIREIDVATTAYDPTTMTPLIALRHARVTALNGGGTPGQETTDYRKLCFQLDWKPDMDFLHNNQVAMLCSKATDHLPAPTDETIEIVCMHFMAQMLATVASDKHSALPHHLQKYIAWAEDVLKVIDAYSILQKPEWAEIFSDKGRRATFLESVSAMSPAHRAWVEFGHNLVSIIRGETDPLHLMFNHKLASDIYRGAVFTYSLERLAAYVDLVAHKNSGINILEIGAGTGSGTEPVLRVLEQQGRYAGATPRYSRYDYTDISPGFFEGAKRRFGTHANRMNFKILDIERDPSEQGFEDGTYDVVVAVSVIHATTDIGRSLTHIRRLMKPGGHLLLMEPTSLRSVIIPFFAGVLPGWWLGTEPERELTALFTKDEWDRTLRRVGFTGVDVVLEDDTNTSAHVCSFLASRVEAPSETTQSPPQILILANNTPSQQTAAARIQSSLQSTSFTNNSVISPSSIPNAEQGAILVSLLELEDTTLVDMSDQDFSNLHEYVGISTRQVWITHGGGPSARRPESALIAGFGQSIVLERPGFIFVHLDIDDMTSLATITTKVLEKLSNSAQIDVETDLAEYQGMVHVPRAIEAKEINDQYNAQFGRQEPVDTPIGAQPTIAVELQFAPGRADNFQFLQVDRPDHELAAGEVLVQVIATGITPRDIMITLNQVSDDHIGQDFAGIVTKTGPGVELLVGDPVCGMCEVGGFKTFIRGHESTLMRIPDNICFTDAASLPSASLVAHYGLTRIARLEAEETILVHAAADHVGQLVVQLAQNMGAEVFATVRTSAEKEQLLEQFKIPEDRIFSCRTLEFANQIMSRTNGHGVDVVFNSLAGDILMESWRCMAPLGRFVETGMQDGANYASLPTAPFQKGATFATLDLGALSLNTRLMGRMMKEIEAMLLANPQILGPPRSVKLFKPSEIEDAIGYMQSGSGRAVVDWSVADVIQVIPKNETYTFSKDSSYVIAGGLGGIGRSIAAWMADRGAANLILLSRSGTKTEASKSFVAKLEAQGVRVFAPSCDITDANAVAAVIYEAQRNMPLIRGCVHSGMVVETDMFDRMSLDKFKASIRPKVQGTWNLHNNLPSNLDFFVLLSSLAGVHGAPVQSNYAAGCAFQDAFARFRQSNGQHAVAFDMGVVTTIGYVAERSDLAKSLAMSYTSHDVIDESDILFMFEQACIPRTDTVQTPTWESQWLSALTTPAQVAKSGLVKEHAWMQKPKFRHLYQIDRTAASVESDTHGPSYEALLKETKTLEEARTVISNALVTRLSRSLMVPVEDIDMHMPMYKYGVDSLVAVEIQFWFTREFKTKVSVLQMLSGNTIAELSLIAAEKCEYLVK